jgi:hypothetical protein
VTLGWMCKTFHKKHPRLPSLLAAVLLFGRKIMMVISHK